MSGLRRINWRTIALYLTAFLLPCLIVVASMWIADLYPFGDKTILWYDTEVSYTYYFQGFFNALLGSDGIMYSFSKSLGGNMLAGYATDCFSPVSIFGLLFDTSNPVNYFTFAIIIKYGLAGVSALLYLRNRFKNLSPVFHFSLAMAYSMMLFMTTQNANLFWMDAVYMLPLVMLGIYRLVHQGKSVLLFVSVLLSIIINWYNGYMICLFTILFYIFESFLAAPNAKKVRLKFLVFPGRFSIVFTLAVVASAAVLIPCAIGLLMGKGGMQSNLFDIGFRFYFPDVFRSLYLGVYEKEILPQLYCGMLTLVCVVWYFINPNISRREKVGSAIFVSFMILSTWFAPLDRVWCGLRDGTSFYCRFTFLISALFIFIAARNLMTLNKKSYKSLIGAGVLVFIVAVIIMCSGHFPRFRYFAIAAFVSVFYPASLILWDMKKGILKNLIAATIVTVVVCEAFVSCQLVFKSRADMGLGSSYNAYEQYYSQGEEQYNSIDSSDGTDINDYRLCKTYSYMTPSRQIMSMESLTFGYSQLAQYDSTYDDHVQNFLCAMGYAPDLSCWTSYYNPILVSDSLLGVRYVVTDEKPIGFIDTGISDPQMGDNIPYENPYALPLGYGASKDVLTDIEFSDSNPFENQNQMLRKLTGDENDEYFTRIDAKQVSRTTDKVVWELDVPANSIVYGYFAGESNLSADVYDNEKNLGLTMNGFSHGVFPLTKNSIDETHTISLVTPSQQPGNWHLEKYEIPEDYEITPHFYMLDMDKAEKALSKLAEKPFEIDIFDNGYVYGTYEADESELLFTTIPYDAGWTIKVNGEIVDPKIIQKTFIGIEVAAGKNEIEMSYISPGLIPGAIISVSALSIYIIYSAVLRRKKLGKLSEA